MIERDGARTAYLTSSGHEDTLAIGKIFQKRAGLSEREMSHLNRLSMADPPLIARELVFGVHERVDYRGRVIVPLAAAELDRVGGRGRRRGRRVGRRLPALELHVPGSRAAPGRARCATALPGVFVSASVDVAPVLGRVRARRRRPR